MAFIKKIRYLLYLLVFIIFTFCFTMALISYVNRDYIHKNVFVNNIDVSGLTKKEALDILEKNFRLDRLTIKYDEQTWDKNFNELGFAYDTKKAVEDAFSIGRKGSVKDSVVAVIKLYTGTRKDVKLGYKHDFKRLEEYVSPIEKALYISPVDSTIYAQNGVITLTEGRDGRKVNTNKVIDDVKKGIENYSDKIEINLQVEEVLPKFRYSELQKINGMISAYQTIYSMDDANRAYNVAVAAQKMDGQIIMPGEEASFMSKLGSVTVANGFLISKIILDNEYVDGVGGGVCQVSSTLYNALLESNIEITERSHHTFASAYVPMGRDATVSDPLPDLKYKNPYDFPIYIRNYASKGVMRTEVYGDLKKAKKAQIYSVVSGNSATTYKVVDGVTSVVSRDMYLKHP